MAKTEITVTDATGAGIQTETSEPEIYTARHWLPLCDRPSAPESQLEGPPTPPLVQ